MVPPGDEGQGDHDDHCDHCSPQSRRLAGGRLKGNGQAMCTHLGESDAMSFTHRGKGGGKRDGKGKGFFWGFF